MTTILAVRPREGDADESMAQLAIDIAVEHRTPLIIVALPTRGAWFETYALMTGDVTGGELSAGAFMKAERYMREYLKLVPSSVATRHLQCEKWSSLGDIVCRLQCRSLIVAKRDLSLWRRYALGAVLVQLGAELMLFPDRRGLLSLRPRQVPRVHETHPAAAPESDWDLMQ